jgi:hypothetical protein
MQIFARMLKVDEAARTVTGVIADETLDLSGEIFDYATSKAHFEAWSGGIHKATAGKSVGNVRAMHGNVVAGKLNELTANDAEKSITVTAHIVDDSEWNKIQAGCYTGFSIGGKYEKKWADPDDATKKRYTAIPSEVSIVDLPCNPGAQFTVIKADGAQEMRKFVLADATASDVVADEPVEKGMGHVAQLACILREVGYLTSDQFNEAAYEGDGSTVPAQLQEWLKTGAGLLTAMASEEAAEVVAESGDAQEVDVPVIALAAGDELGKADDVVELEKVGAKHSKTTLDHHDQIAKHAQGILDHVAALAGDVPKEDGEAAKAATDAGLASKAMGEASDALAKAADDLAKLTTDRDDALAKVATLTAEVEALKAMPVPVKAAALAISKADDGAAPDATADLRKQVAELPEGPDKVRAMIKLAYQDPK